MTISSVLKNCRSARKIGRPRPSGITNAATVASAIVETVAMRTPAMIAGSASGSSTRRRTWNEPIPIPRAASSTSAGTERNPVRMFRNRIRSV